MTTAAQLLPHPTWQDTSRSNGRRGPAREAGPGVCQGHLFPVGRRAHSESETETITSPTTRPSPTIGEIRPRFLAGLSSYTGSGHVCGGIRVLRVCHFKLLCSLGST